MCIGYVGYGQFPCEHGSVQDGCRIRHKEIEFLLL